MVHSLIVTLTAVIVVLIVYAVTMATGDGRQVRMNSCSSGCPEEKHNIVKNIIQVV